MQYQAPPSAPNTEAPVAPAAAPILPANAGTYQVPPDGGGNYNDPAPAPAAAPVAPVVAPVAPVAPSPEMVQIPAERLKAIERQLQEGTQFRQTEEQKAAKIASDNRLEEVRKRVTEEFADMGWPDNDDRLRNMIAYQFSQTPEGRTLLYEHLLSPENPTFRQTDWYKAGMEHYQFQQATAFVQSYFGGFQGLTWQEGANLRDELIKVSEGNPIVMEQIAKTWASNRRQTNLQTIVNTGQERVEGSGGFAGGAMSEREFMQRYGAPDGGGIPRSRENAERAKRNMEAGIYG